MFIEGAGAKMVLIPADTEAFQIDFTALEKAITPKTKAVVVNSPNNPSGAVYSEETVKNWRLCWKPNLPTIIIPFSDFG